jgi:hypothetical protein
MKAKGWNETIVRTKGPCGRGKFFAIFGATTWFRQTQTTTLLETNPERRAFRWSLIGAA